MRRDLKLKFWQVMLAVLLFAAILAVRNELARMRRRQVEIEIARLVRYLEEHPGYRPQIWLRPLLVSSHLVGEDYGGGSRTLVRDRQGTRGESWRPEQDFGGRSSTLHLVTPGPTPLPPLSNEGDARESAGAYTL